jgi:hypothetical protein
MNLEVYLNIKVTLVKSLLEAIEYLKKDKIDIVLSLDLINKEESAVVLTKFLKSSGKKVPIIISGNQKEDALEEDIYYTAGKFNIQAILKCSANILGITAKKMSELNVGSFYPISIESLKGLSKAPCHIYPTASAHKFLVRQDDPMDEVISDLANKGIPQVFVSSGDRLVMTNKISLTLIDKITESLNNLEATAPIEKKLQALSDGYEFAAANLFSSDEIKKQMQEIASAAARVMGDVAHDSTQLKGLLAILTSNKDGYIFTHSMITSYVSYHLIKNLTWGGEGQVEKINFVLFFHDIFLAPIYLKFPELKYETEILEFNLLNDKERDIVLNHAKLAAELVVGYKRCPMGADILIKQHHGMKRGKGFIKFYMEDLSPLSKIFLIAEMYVEEFFKSQEVGAAPFNRAAVIPKLISEFKTPSYTKLVQSLVNVPL